MRTIGYFLLLIVAGGCSGTGSGNAAGDLAPLDQRAASGDLSMAMSCADDSACGDGGVCDRAAGACRGPRPCDPDAKEEVCCCNNSDQLGGLLCRDGQWTCDSPYTLWQGSVCTGARCGGPCSWPCMDMASGTD